MRLPALLLALSLSCGACAADPLSDLSTALGGDDFEAKRAAIQAVTGLPKDQDEKVLDALVRALGDRQAKAIAADALRSRAGVAKPKPGFPGGGYPNHPSQDTPAEWGKWVAMWKKDQTESKRIKDLEKKAKEAEEKEAQKKKEAEDAAKKPADGTAAATDANAIKTAQVEAIQGVRCRVHFRNGGSQVYALIAKRTDADGNLLSVRVAHLDGGGTEVLSADIIVRIEEDVK
jgi:hypothetical protein